MQKMWPGRAGITTVVEPQSGLDDLPFYQRARDEGVLACRLIAAMFYPPGADLGLLADFEAALRRRPAPRCARQAQDR